MCQKTSLFKAIVLFFVYFDVLVAVAVQFEGCLVPFANYANYESLLFIQNISPILIG